MNEATLLNLQSYAQTAKDACGDRYSDRCIRTMYLVKKEVEYITKAQVRVENFIDDAFRQAGQRGIQFSESQKSYCKDSLLMTCKSKIQEKDDYEVFKLEYPRWGEEFDYESSKMEMGASLVITGYLIQFVPNPICQEVGKGVTELGFQVLADTSLAPRR